MRFSRNGYVRTDAAGRRIINGSSHSVGSSPRAGRRGLDIECRTAKISKSGRCISGFRTVVHSPLLCRALDGFQVSYATLRPRGLPSPDKVRHCYCEQDTDDQNHDHDFDQSETAFASVDDKSTHFTVSTSSEVGPVVCIRYVGLRLVSQRTNSGWSATAVSASMRIVP